MLLRGYHFLPPTPPTPDTEVPQAELPQTGEHTSNAGFIGLLSMIFFSFRRILQTS